jgi:hypothetical protein
VFSRDDLGGRGGFHPLFWVLGPLVLGAVLITGIGILARSTQGFPDIELADDLRRVADNGDPLLAEATDFEWDRVCVFPPYLAKEDVDATLGIDWGVVGGGDLDDRNLLVFLEGDRVVKHFYLLRGIVDEPATEGDCRAPDDESTRL